MRELTSMDFVDHVWKLKSYDQHGVVVVKIHCEECSKEFGGVGGEYLRSIIQNLLANFKSPICTQHCKRKEIMYNDHRQRCVQ